MGAAEIVETGNVRIPFLIAAPTMRVPMKLHDSVNPYLAARAVFLLIQHGMFDQGTLTGERISDAVKTVAFPGLGTGVGEIGHRRAPIMCELPLKRSSSARPRFPALGRKRRSGIRSCTQIECETSSIEEGMAQHAAHS